MKSLIVVPWDHEYGGVASVVGNLAICLKGLGHKVLFFHPDGQAIIQKKRITRWGLWGFPGFQPRVGLPFDLHPFRSALAFFALFPFTLLQLIRLIKKHDIEIVNIHYPVDHLFYVLVVSPHLSFFASHLNSWSRGFSSW